MEAGAPGRPAMMDAPPVFPAVQVEGLTRTFGSQIAVDRLSLTLEAGTIFALLGCNGSGKSTTLKMLSGLLEPTAGSILINGLDLQVEPIAVKRILGVLPEEMALVELLSVYEHLLMAGEAYGVARETALQRAKKLLDFLGLWDSRHKFPIELSYGMAKRTGLAMALMHRPKVLLLDEPFEGMDPSMVSGLRGLFTSLAARGVTIFLTSHSMPLMQKLIHRFGIISDGRLAFEGSIANLERVGTSLEDLFFRFATPPSSEELEWLG